MKMTDCNSIMDSYLMLDKGEKIPLEMTLHFLLCGKCRRQVKALRKAEKASSRPLEIPLPVTDSSIEEIMLQIDPDYKPAKNPIGLFGWIAGGIMTIVFMLAFLLVPSVRMNSAIQIMFFIVFAVVVTAYCAFFVGTNMDYFVKLLDTKKA